MGTSCVFSMLKVHFLCITVLDSNLAMKMEHRLLDWKWKNFIFSIFNLYLFGNTELRNYCGEFLFRFSLWFSLVIFPLLKNNERQVLFSFAFVCFVFGSRLYNFLPLVKKTDNAGPWSEQLKDTLNGLWIGLMIVNLFIAQTYLGLDSQSWFFTSPINFMRICLNIWVVCKFQKAKWAVNLVKYRYNKRQLLDSLVSWNFLLKPTLERLKDCIPRKECTNLYISSYIRNERASLPWEEKPAMKFIWYLSSLCLFFNQNHLYLLQSNPATIFNSIPNPIPHLWAGNEISHFLRVSAWIDSFESSNKVKQLE